MTVVIRKKYVILYITTEKGEIFLYKQCKTEASSARQKQMTQGLLQLMLENHYQDISVSDICRKLNISRNSFYRYFSDKDSMLYALMDGMLMEFEVCVQYSDEYGTRLPTGQVILQLLRFWKSQKPLLDAIAYSGLSTLLTTRAILPWVTRPTPMDGFRIRDLQDQKYANFFCIGGILNMLIAWHHEDFDQSEEEMAALVHKLLTEPLFYGNDTQI